MACGAAGSRAVAGPQASLASVSPSARYGAGMVYDAKDGYVLLFGGYDSQHDLNDTWMFLGGNWTKLSPPLSPSARYAPAMAYDGGDGYVLLFGGSTPAAGLNDTWKFTGGNWTQLAPTLPPRVRWGAGMTY